MLATTPRTATPAAAGIALVFVGVLAAGPASVSAATAQPSTKPPVSAGPYAAAIWTTSDTTDDTEGMRGVRRKTSPASLARAPRQQRECGPADFEPIMGQMPEGCADMILATARTGEMPSREAMCWCIAAVEVADLPGCEFGGVIFDPAAHSCVAIVDASTAPPTWLEVTAGASFCQIDANGCATDGAGEHGNNEDCTIQVNQAGYLTATEFDTESQYDHVTINGWEYSGSNRPDRTAVSAGSTFQWHSDFSITNAGWTICLDATTMAPTVAAAPIPGGWACDAPVSTASGFRISCVDNPGLTTIPPGLFNFTTALENLYLYNNAITAIPVGLFDSTPALNLLHLNNNAITAIPTGLFEFTTALRYLWLSNNAITAIPVGLFEFTTALRYLYLVNNRIECMPVQLVSPAIAGQLLSPISESFFYYQVLANCTLHPNGTAECRNTNCEAGYGRRHAGTPPGSAPGPAAAAMIRCERFAAIPFAELARTPTLSGCGDAFDALLDNVRSQTFYPGAPKFFDGLLQPATPTWNFSCTASGLVQNTLVDENDDDQITLSLELDGPCDTTAAQPDVYAQCVTGRLSISPADTPDCNGTYTAKLRATDVTGASDIIGGDNATWEMKFRGRNTLPINSIRPAKDRMGEDTIYSNYTFTDHTADSLVSADRALWAYGDMYHLVPLNVTAREVESSDISFRLDPNPDGFFVNGDTGEIIGVPRVSRGTDRIRVDTSACRLLATAAGFDDTVLGTFNFTFAFKDTHPNHSTFATNGPNSRVCANGGVPKDETTAESGWRSEFDGSYTCDCAAALHAATNQPYRGANCEEVPAEMSSSSAGTDSGVAVGASLGAVVLVMLAALVAFRVQVYRLKYRPVDVGATQEEVLASLGLAATQNIRPAELGISLLFDRALPPNGGADGGARLEADLVAVLRRAAPRIKAGLQAATITFAAAASRRVLVIVPKSKLALPGEAVVELLAGKAGKGKLAVGGGRIVDASIAIPRRVPREVPRGALTRIRQLGEGAFGEVHQYQLEERAMPSLFVAAKSIKAVKSSGGADARAALLREAALGALFEHRNVLVTVGVCTVPRDVPALLLLSFCAEGTLEALAAAASPTSMTVAERLTYCAQTLQGLQHIASIRIVHRDVAARNVLLDSTMVCKVSDFGLATALQEDGKEYVRANEALAMRWAAPEVIAGGKYSVQSDVWAAGVLAHEVFACGELPYADAFDNLTEISEFVKGGGRLGRPDAAACPVEVYEQLMLPCFAIDPADRPTFGELYSAAVRHGAAEDDAAMAERAAARRAHESEQPQQDKRPGGPGDRALLGPSVHHLASTLVPGVQQAVVAIQTTKGHASQSSFDGLDPADASIWHTVHSFAKPASAATLCPRDGEMGCGYVDILVGEDDVGIAKALLSYSWGYLVAEVSAALSAWCERHDRDSKRTAIWICSLCLNQHRLGGGDAATPEDLAKQFGDRVVALGRILPMLEPWHDPGYVKRAWCLFELYTSIQHRETVEIDIILSPKQARNFRDRINTDGTDAHAIDEALAHVRSADAEASVPADLDAIRALVQQYSGGFGTLDDTVRQYLRRWFVSQGGVKVVARARRLAASNSTQISKVERVRTCSQEDAELPLTFAASIGSAPGCLENEGAQRDGKRDGNGGPGSGSPEGLNISRRDGEPVGLASNPTRCITSRSPTSKPGGAAARHNLEVGSTFAKMGGAGAPRIDKAKVLHMLNTKTTIADELGPAIRNIGDHRVAHYYPQGMD